MCTYAHTDREERIGDDRSGESCDKENISHLYSFAALDGGQPNPMEHSLVTAARGPSVSFMLSQPGEKNKEGNHITKGESNSLLYIPRVWQLLLFLLVSHLRKEKEVYTKSLINEISLDAAIMA